MIMENVKIKQNVLTKEQCVQIISDAKNFEYDILKKDIAEQNIHFTKEQLDANTVERSFDQSSDMRKVSQSPMEPVFSEWDGKPVYRCKVMKYEKGEYVREHRDAEWMCMSNYWAPDSNKS